MARITINMTFKEAILVMVEGNPGAVAVLGQLFKKRGEDAIVLCCHLDEMGIYGSDIWIAYKDVCGEKIDKLIPMITDRKIKALVESAKREV